MLLGAGMRDQYWDFAMEYSVYILNRTVRDGMSITPHEAVTGIKPDLSNLRIFGCCAFAKVPSELRHKWEPKARKCIFLGIDAEKVGHRVLDVKSGRVFVSRDVKFNERLLPAKRALDLAEAERIRKTVSAAPLTQGNASETESAAPGPARGEEKGAADFSVTRSNFPVLRQTPLRDLPSTTAPAPNDFDQQRDAKELSDQRARDATELSAFDERTPADLNLPL